MSATNTATTVAGGSQKSNLSINSYAAPIAGHPASLPTPGKIPGHNVFVFDEVTISSNFDNGNVARCERNPHRSYEFRIWTAPDNLGTPYQSKHCAWFHFSISGLPKGCVLRIQIVNTSNHGGLYKHDMRPVYRGNTTNQRWMRIKTSVRYVKENDAPQLYFEHSVDQENDTLYFSFTYPYSYTQMQRELNAIDEVHSNNDFSIPDSIFYQRELVNKSLDGRRIDLLTITSVDGAAPHLINRSNSGGESSADEGSSKKVKTLNELYAPLLNGLFPEVSKPEQRPPDFPNKEVVFISARVHPGEVPAQHTFKGILDLLLDPNDLRAKELRRRYVFKLVPMLNPDGVYRGHFRMDQLGNNLNRYYITPDPFTQPSIYAAKSIIDYYANSGRLSVYLDFHAHASKRGCFIYGNVLDTAEDQIQNQLYCKLIAMNSAHFDYEGCLFSKEHMTRIDPGDAAKGLTAEGSGRVATYLNHRLIHSYTIECNYNTSRIGNEIAPTDGDPMGANVTPPSSFATSTEKYTPSSWAGVGRGCIVALLDIRGHNPCSRIPKSKFKTLERVRNAVGMEVRARKEYAGRGVNRERERRRATVAQIQSGDSGRNVRSSSRSGKSGKETMENNPDNALWRRIVTEIVEKPPGSRDSTPRGSRSNSISAATSSSDDGSAAVISTGSDKTNGRKMAHAMFVSLKRKPRNSRRERTGKVTATNMAKPVTIGVADVDGLDSVANSIAAANASAAGAAIASNKRVILENSTHQHESSSNQENSPQLESMNRPPPTGGRIPPSNLPTAVYVRRDAEPKGKLSVSERSSSELVQRGLIAAHRQEKNNYVNYNTSDSECSMASLDRLSRNKDTPDSIQDFVTTNALPVSTQSHVQRTFDTHRAGQIAENDKRFGSSVHNPNAAVEVKKHANEYSQIVTNLAKSNEDDHLSQGSNSTVSSPSRSIYHKGAAAASAASFSKNGNGSKDKRKILGKKLSAAGVALLMDSSRKQGNEDDDTSSTMMRGSWFENDFASQLISEQTAIKNSTSYDAQSEGEYINDVDSTNVSRHFTDDGVSVYHGGRSTIFNAPRPSIRSSRDNGEVSLDLAVRGSAPNSGASSPVPSSSSNPSPVILLRKNDTNKVAGGRAGLADERNESGAKSNGVPGIALTSFNRRVDEASHHHESCITSARAELEHINSTPSLQLSEQQRRRSNGMSSKSNDDLTSMLKENSGVDACGDSSSITKPPIRSPRAALSLGLNTEIDSDVDINVSSGPTSPYGQNTGKKKGFLK